MPPSGYIAAAVVAAWSVGRLVGWLVIRYAPSETELWPRGDSPPSAKEETNANANAGNDQQNRVRDFYFIGDFSQCGDHRQQHNNNSYSFHSR